MKGLMPTSIRALTLLLAGLNLAQSPAAHAGAVNPDISQQAYIKASNTASFDEFGAAIARFEDTLVVGAPGEDSSASRN